jgi:two-component system sensor histidine kinase MtrB
MHRNDERLNRALHELRRPLQALVLLEQGPDAPAASAPEAARRGLLELAACALDELDAAVNGGGGCPVTRRVSCRELVHASLERWRPPAARGSVKLYWDAGPAYVEADPAGVARALDNLLVNAIEHGAPPLVVTGATVADRLRITVASGAAGPEPPGNGRDPRRGHGIPVVSEVARAHGGRFALYRSEQGCVAALELPLSGGAGALAA